jgi:hypothetical protein
VYSVSGTECDVIVPSIANPIYSRQRYPHVVTNNRAFIAPPWRLIGELLDFSKPVQYDIAHIVTPACLAFIPVLPLLWLRRVKVYASYHVFVEYYRDLYAGDRRSFTSKVLNFICDLIPYLYYMPLAAFSGMNWV